VKRAKEVAKALPSSQFSVEDRKKMGIYRESLSKTGVNKALKEKTSMFPPRQSKSKSESPLLISQYLSEECVAFLKVDTRDEALTQLVDMLDQAGKIEDKKQFYQAILDREHIVSTGIGMGVAIPHAKLPGYETFFIAIGIHQKGIAWEALDGAPVRLIFMIGGPDDKQTEYLKILSRLTLAIKDEERRKKMLQLSSSKDIMALFKAI
jgi:nitrogen PTS system EIIA component